MWRRLGLAGLAAGLTLAAEAWAADDPARIAADRIARAYVAAWDRADAAALGAQFAADGDFINPAGVYARGPGAVAGFYRTAFGAGYAGSRGAFRVALARRIAPDVVAIDGEWSIEGAHAPDGALRPREAGIATAILVRRQGAWKIGLLREQEGATKIGG